jgi:hypothetical protein
MKKYFLILFALFPLPLFAADLDLYNAGTTFATVVNYVVNMIYLLIPIFYILCFIIFFWGLTKFIIGAGNKEELSKGKKYMMWGILILFILISFRTIIGILSNQLDFGNAQTIPQLPTSGGTSVNSTIQYNNVIP